MKQSEKPGGNVLPLHAAPSGAGLTAALSARYRAPLIAFFRRRTSNDIAEAEDLAQEVLLRVVRRHERSPVAEPDAFIFQTARNLIKDRHRHAKVREDYRAAVELRSDAAERVNPERVLQGRQELARVVEALGGLNEQTRDMFILNRLEGMKYREIAELYGVSQSSVRKQLFKAMSHLMRTVDLA